MALIFSLGGLIVWYVGGRDVLAGSMRLMGRARGRVLSDDEANAIAGAWPAIVPFADSPAGLEDLRDRGWRLAILGASPESVGRCGRSASWLPE